MVEKHRSKYSVGQSKEVEVKFWSKKSRWVEVHKRSNYCVPEQRPKNDSGGEPFHELAVKYDENGWTRVGQLIQGRYYHRSVTNGNAIMHIGGNSGNYDEDL